MSTFEQRKSMRGTGDGKQDRKGSVDAQAVLNLICSVMAIFKSTHLLGHALRRLVLGGRSRVEKPAGFILCEDGGQLLGLVYVKQGLEQSRLSSVAAKKNRSTVMAVFTLAAPSEPCPRWRPNSLKSSTVAVSGGRPINAARFFRQRMYSFCVFSPNWRAVMSSIMR